MFKKLSYSEGCPCETSKELETQLKEICLNVILNEHA